MINKKINAIRIKLDLLDNKMLDIIKKRNNLVDLVLKEEQFKKEIIDKKRIKDILKRIKFKSINKNIDPKITNKIWEAMIKAFISYEFRNFKK